MGAEKPVLDEIGDGGAAGPEGGTSPVTGSCYENSDLWSVLGRLAHAYLALWSTRTDGPADASGAPPLSSTLLPHSAFATSCE